MTENKLPVSIIISALNEEHRIADTIISAQKNNPSEIIVVEGGSTDKTVEVAKGLTPNVYSTENFGLGYKRAYGVKMASQKYILTLDADQILEDGALEKMIEELEDNNFVGIQAGLRGHEHETYWEKGMNYNISLTHSKPKESKMIGTPALFRADIIKENSFNENISGSCDDTDLCYRLTQKGYKLGISTAICFQKHRSTFESTVKKFMWYGEGDSEFVRIHPEKFWDLYTHPIRNYMIKRSITAIKNFDLQYIPYFTLIGMVRHYGFYKNKVKFLLGNKLDDRTSKRNDLNY